MDEVLDFREPGHAHQHANIRDSSAERAERPRVSDGLVFPTPGSSDDKKNLVGASPSAMASRVRVSLPRSPTSPAWTVPLVAIPANP